MLSYRIELERETEEEGGRWIAEVIDIPGCITWGATEDAAVQAAEVLALQVVADRITHGEMVLDGPLALRFEILPVEQVA